MSQPEDAAGRIHEKRSIWSIWSITLSLCISPLSLKTLSDFYRRLQLHLVRRHVPSLIWWMGDPGLTCCSVMLRVYHHLWVEFVLSWNWSSFMCSTEIKHGWIINEMSKGFRTHCNMWGGRRCKPTKLNHALAHIVHVSFSQQGWTWGFKRVNRTENNKWH